MQAAVQFGWRLYTFRKPSISRTAQFHPFGTSTFDPAFQPHQRITRYGILLDPIIKRIKEPELLENLKKCRKQSSILCRWINGRVTLHQLAQGQFQPISRLWFVWKLIAPKNRKIFLKKWSWPMIWRKVFFGFQTFKRTYAKIFETCNRYCFDSNRRHKSIFWCRYRANKYYARYSKSISCLWPNARLRTDNSSTSFHRIQSVFQMPTTWWNEKYSSFNSNNHRKFLTTESIRSTLVPIQIGRWINLKLYGHGQTVRGRDWKNMVFNTWSK